jgi:hypothetical protein
MAELKGIFESTNITGQNYSFVSTQDLENGMLVHMGPLVTGSKDIYNAEIPTAATLADQPVYIVGDPAWSYDNSSITNQNEDAYVIKAGKVFRVYELKANNKFAIADYGIDGGAPEVGKFVGLQNGSGKPVLSAAAPTDSAFVGEIVYIRNLGAEYFVGQTVDTKVSKVVIKVVKNG